MKSTPEATFLQPSIKRDDYQSRDIWTQAGLGKSRRIVCVDSPEFTRRALSSVLSFCLLFQNRCLPSLWQLLAFSIFFLSFFFYAFSPPDFLETKWRKTRRIGASWLLPSWRKAWRPLFEKGNHIWHPMWGLNFWD